MLTALPSALLCLSTNADTNKHRYKNFLGLNNPNDFMAAAAQMKKQGDFTSLRDDAQSIAAVRSEGMAADKVLAINSVEEGAAAARCVWLRQQQYFHSLCLDFPGLTAQGKNRVPLVMRWHTVQPAA